MTRTKSNTKLTSDTDLLEFEKNMSKTTDNLQSRIITDMWHCKLTDKNIAKIADTWLSKKFKIVARFCKSVNIEAIHKSDYIITPCHCVDITPVEVDDEPFEQKTRQLVSQVYKLQYESKKLAIIVKDIKNFGFDAGSEIHGP